MSSLRPVTGSPDEVLAALRSWSAAGEEPEPLVVATSGSTGEPKRVLLSRRAMTASATATQARLGGPGQWLLALPPTYVAGLQVLFRSVLAGTEPVVLTDDLSSAVARMGPGRRYTSLVPTQLRRMLASEAGTEALQSFDTILLGGAAADPPLRSAATAAGLNVVLTYGMTETCGGCVYDGVALDGVAVALSSSRRIRLAGPVLFDGYEGSPEQTAEVMDGSWFLAPDLGLLDEDGRLQVLGRADDVVVSGGTNVPAQAVALRLREHPGLDAVEVLGVPDPEWGHRVAAVVVSSSPPTLAELRDWVTARYPREWAPRQMVSVSKIPLLGNGKVDRQRLEFVLADDAGVSW